MDFCGAGPQSIRSHFQVAYLETEKLPQRDACRQATPALAGVRQKAEELMQQSEMAGAASVLAGLSAQARVVVGEWGADEIDVDLEEEAQEGGGDFNTFDLASSVLEELGEGGNGEDE